MNSIWYELTKIFLSALIIWGVTNVDKFSTTLSAILISIPLTSLLAIIWMGVEGRENAHIASWTYQTFWFVLPTLIFFLVFPYMLSSKLPFLPSLLVSLVIMVGFYFGTWWLLGKFGVKF